MTEGREVLGYTLIRRSKGGREVYRVALSAWSDLADDARTWPSVSDLLSSIGNPPLYGGTLHIGRVVRIPGEQTVEQIPEPEDADAWGVRHKTFNGEWSWMHKSGAWSPCPQAMDWEYARKLRDRDPLLRFMSPLRVTESEPRTVVEEVECE